MIVLKWLVILAVLTMLHIFYDWVEKVAIRRYMRKKEADIKAQEALTQEERDEKLTALRKEADRMTFLPVALVVGVIVGTAFYILVRFSESGI